MNIRETLRRWLCGDLIEAKQRLWERVADLERRLEQSEERFELIHARRIPALWERVEQLQEGLDMANRCDPSEWNEGTFQRIAEKIDADDIAWAIDNDAVASAIDKDSLADCIDLEAVADHVDTNAIGRSVLGSIADALQLANAQGF